MSLTEDAKDWLKSRINDAQNTINSYQETIASDQEKIERIDTACNQLSTQYDTANSAKSDLKNYTAGSTWAGAKHDSYNDDKNDADTAADTYCDAILDARNQLQQKKTQLSAESANLGGLITSLGSQISGWWDQITN